MFCVTITIIFLRIMELLEYIEIDRAIIISLFARSISEQEAET